MRVAATNAIAADDIVVKYSQLTSKARHARGSPITAPTINIKPPMAASAAEASLIFFEIGLAVPARISSRVGTWATWRLIATSRIWYRVAACRPLLRALLVGQPVRYPQVSPANHVHS